MFGIKSHLRRLQAILAMSALGLALGMTTISGHAGTNGQEIDYNVGCYANYSETTGWNQNGQWRDRWFYDPAADPYNYCSQSPQGDWGWWWVGNVTVHGWWGYDGNSGNNDAGYQGCYVPKSQDGNWTQCHTPS